MVKNIKQMGGNTLDYSRPDPVPPFRWSRYSNTLIVVGPGVLMLFIGLVVWGLSQFQMGTDTEKLTSTQIEQIGRFKFPPGASGVRSHYIAWQDFSLHVTFTMPPASLDQFMRSTISIPCRPTASVTSLGFTGAGNISWWSPGNPQEYVLASNDPEHGPEHPSDAPPASMPAIMQYILIDKTNPQLHRVWMHVHDQ